MATNVTPEGRRLNRRVELEVYSLVENVVQAQDIIYMKDGRHIGVVYVRQEKDELEYQTFSDGKIYYVPVGQVDSVNYAAGTHQEFAAAPPKKVAKKRRVNPEAVKPPEDYLLEEFGLWVEYIRAPRIRSKNFENIDLSDWERNGLRTLDPGSNEGRVEIPLADETFSHATHGINFGILVGITDKVGVLGEWQYSASSRLDVSSWMIGGSYDLIINNGLCLAAVSKIGISKISANLGVVNRISGYNSPVFSEGAVYGGDYLTAELRKLAYQIGFRGDIALRGDGVRLNLQLGVGGTTIGSKRFWVSSPDGDGAPMKLNFKDDSAVSPDGSSRQAGVRPSLKSMGVYFTIGYSGFGGRKRKYIY